MKTTPVELRGLEPLAFWMQTVGTTVNAVRQRSVTHVWVPAHDGCSAGGLLYLAAVWDDGREQEHRQDRIDIGSASLMAPEAVGLQYA